MTKKVIFFIAMSILFLDKTNAECSYELRQEAANIKTNIDIRKQIIDYEGVKHPEVDASLVDDKNSNYNWADFIYLNLINMSPNLYFTIENVTEETGLETYTYEQLTDGRYEYEAPDNDIIREFEIKVYSNTPECKNEELRVIKETLPKFNEYAHMSFCENSNKYYCQEYITNEITVDENKLFEEYNQNKPIVEEEQPVKPSFFEQYKMYFIILGILIVLAIIISFVAKKIITKKKKEEIQGGL